MCFAGNISNALQDDQWFLEMQFTVRPHTTHPQSLPNTSLFPQVVMNWGSLAHRSRGSFVRYLLCAIRLNRKPWSADILRSSWFPEMFNRIEVGFYLHLLDHYNLYRVVPAPPAEVDAAATMLHWRDGLGDGLVSSSAWFPANMTPGIHTEDLGFASSDQRIFMLMFWESFRCLWQTLTVQPLYHTDLYHLLADSSLSV